MSRFSRRAFLESAALVGASSTLFPGILYAQASGKDEITVADIEAAERLAGLSFTPEERDMMLEDLQNSVDDYRELRELRLPNDVPPSMTFDPQLGGKVAPRLQSRVPVNWRPDEVERPASAEDLAFLTVPQLSGLLRERKVTSRELTELYLSRLKKYDPVLECVVTLTEDRARRQARAADAELNAGHWRGPLHGIPWGAKDLLAVRGYPTTWGAMPYKDQVFEEDAAVVSRLDEAGAVLVAKLTLGALAYGDRWFGGRTNNPWNIEQGSSGSSAGPGAAVSAGLVGFAIGSETWGSISSPSNRNGVTGFRPSYGRVSRKGAMALSWTMDKLGPMCRSANGCALVFDAIHGHDPFEPSTVTTPFSWPASKQVTDLRIGFLEGRAESEQDKAVLNVMREAGVDLRPTSLPEFNASPIGNMLFLEAAAAFDDLMISGDVNDLVRQDQGAWPNSFRTAQFAPAVSYINASRARTLLMKKMHVLFESFDAIIMPRGEGGLHFNLTGHPLVTLPNFFGPVEDSPVPSRRRPESFTIIGGLYEDEAALSLAALYQSRTDFHLQKPPIE